MMTMKFWFSGEVDHRIFDAFRPVLARVEAKLNRMCDGRDYGDAVTKFAIIPMILGPEFLAGRSERRLWKRKEQSADYRTIIDFESFQSGDDAERERLLVMNTVDAVRDLHRKAGERFHGNELASDILREFGLALADELPAT
jgi:hypothetical protein